MNLTLERAHEDFRQGLPAGGDQAFQSRHEWSGLEVFGSEPKGADPCVHRTRGL